MDKNSKILITGARGFLGRYVCARLLGWGYKNIYGVETLRQKGHNMPYQIVRGDLRSVNETAWILQETQPDVIIHLAATVGGIGANKANPGVFFYDNISMGVNLIDLARRYVPRCKFVLTSTVCSYPKFTTVPFKEEDIWNGYPEETNAPYGIAKKSLMLMLQAYRQQYDFNGITLIPTNLYGPGDNFNENTSHVIPALIKKFDAAGTYGDVEVWGTGMASREFLYAADAARAIVLAAELYNEPEPINIGNGTEYNIAQITDKLRHIFQFCGHINFNPNYPDGQPRRSLDVTKAREKFGFKANIDIDEGLEYTVKWYKENKHCLA